MKKLLIPPVVWDLEVTMDLFELLKDLVVLHPGRHFDMLRIRQRRFFIEAKARELANALG
jgi:hypothetical protein